MFKIGKKYYVKRSKCLPEFREYYIKTGKKISKQHQVTFWEEIEVVDLLENGAIVKKLNEETYNISNDIFKSLELLGKQRIYTKEIFESPLFKALKED